MGTGGGEGGTQIQCNNSVTLGEIRNKFISLCIAQSIKAVFFHVRFAKL